MRRRRPQQNIRPVRDDPFGCVRAVGGELLLDQLSDAGALPARVGQKSVCPRQCRDSPLERRDIARHVVRSCEAHDGLNDRKRVLGPMVDLARQDRLAFRRSLEFRRALRHPLLELVVQFPELPGFSIEVHEYANLGAQHFGYDRYGHIIDRAHGIAAQPVDIGEMNGRHEDDGGRLEARVLPDQRGEFETVEIGHADVDQDDGHVHLQQLFQGLAPRRDLDEILTEIFRE